MKWEEIDLPAPNEGWAQIRHTSIGLNYIDTYHRSGLYPLPMPTGLGLEAAGVVETVGSGVTSLQPGDRIAYATGPLGAYSERANVPAGRVVKIPDGVTDETAAAMMLKGLTVQYLVRQTYKIQSGDTILVQAAAGGVGLILCQWAKHLGATVIGTAGSQEKAELARAHGCDHTILYRQEDFTARVRELTGGKGVPVVYDAVGKDTFEASLDCLTPLGMMVTYGNASGPVPPIDASVLMSKGSLFLTRPSLAHYTMDDGALQSMATELFGLVEKGVVSIEINQRYQMADAVQAHRDLEARKTTGSTVFIP